MIRGYRCERLLRDADAQVESDRGLLVEDGIILDVIAGSELARAVGAGDIEHLPGTTMPGLVDAHTHLRSTPAVAQASLPEMSFEQWAYALSALTPLPALDDATVAAAELLGAGATAAQIVLHSWGDMDARLDELDAVLRALGRTGLRAVVVLGFTDQAEYLPVTDGDIPAGIPLPERGMAVAEWPELIRAARVLVGEAQSRVRLAIGPVAPQWCSEEGLSVLAAHRGDLRVHAHLLESAAQRTWLGGEEDPLARLRRFGLVGPFASYAHGVHLMPDEIDVVAAAGASLVHCPGSNRRLGVGSAPVSEWLRRGVSSALGMDSQVADRPDLFAEIREAVRTSAEAGDPIAAADAMRMATRGGAAAIGSRGGAIAPGADADFIVVDAECEGGAQQILDQVVDAALIRTVIAGETRLPARENDTREVERMREHLDLAVGADASGRQARIRALAEPLRRVLELSSEAR